MPNNKIKISDKAWEKALSLDWDLALIDNRKTTSTAISGDLMMVSVILASLMKEWRKTTAKKLYSIKKLKVKNEHTKPNFRGIFLRFWKISYPLFYILF